jgi:hypothetical protein
VRATENTGAPVAGYRAGPHPSPWKGPLAALDILLNNLGVGLFLVAAIGDLAAHDAFSSVAGIAFPLAFAIIALDLLLLVGDLGDPFRFFHMLRVIKPRTPMSVGVWSLSVLMIMLVPVVVISVIGWFADVPSGLAAIATVFAALALVPGIGAIAYKGVLFSVTAQPGWRDARWLGAYVCSSGPVLGSAVLLVIAALDDSTAAAKGLRVATLTLVVVSTVALALLRRDLHPELVLRRTRRQRGFLNAGVAVTGLLLPVAALLIGANVASASVAAISLLVAAFAVRLEFVAIPHAAPTV